MKESLNFLFQILSETIRKLVPRRSDLNPSISTVY